MGERTKLGLGILGGAALLGVAGDLLLRATPWGVNFPLWVLALVGVAAGIAIWRGVSLRGEGRWLIVPMVLFAGLFVWRDSGTLAVINGLAVLISLSLVALRSRSGRLVRAGIMDYLYWGLQATGYAYVGPLPAIIQDVAWGEVGSVRYRRLFAVLRGLLISIPLIFVFGGLFVAADAVFEDFVFRVLDFDLERVFGHVFLFCMLAWISAGVLRITLAGGELANPPVSRPAYLKLGMTELGVALGLLNALFLCFVLVQVRYLFGGVGQVVSSSGLTYAEYARRGFFELVTVTALVLPLLLFAHWMMRSDRSLHLRVLNFLSGSLVGLLFVVMASALQRMRLYTAEFGLTELRLYTTAFMIWISTVLVWFLLTVLRGRRDRFAVGALATGLLAVLSLNVINPDALIVQTNVARMQQGERFDVVYLTSLSADAVPSLTTALPDMSDEDRQTAERELAARWGDEPEDWRTYNRSRSRAVEIVTTQLASGEWAPRRSYRRHASVPRLVHSDLGLQLELR